MFKDSFIIEMIGIFSTVIIVISMLFKTTTIKGSLWMRSLNILGSIIFFLYGCLRPALSTALLNGVLVIINTYHIILLIQEQKQKKDKNIK